MTVLNPRKPWLVPAVPCVLFLLLCGAFLTTALTAATAPAAALEPAQQIKGASTDTFPERVHGNSVAIGPNGDPWFGLSVQEGETSLGHLHAGELKVEPLHKGGRYVTTTALQFDSQGSLWFARNDTRSRAIDRRGPDGTVTEFRLPRGEPVRALTVGREGDIWFVRGGDGKKAAAQVGRLTEAGSMEQFPLRRGSAPTSITAGPDGAFWFTEKSAAAIGRITTGGEIQLYPLGPDVQPRQIVAGSDDALWFGENARARRYGKFSDRIGRITTDGQVAELPVPFGKGTSRLAADPVGAIWFTTDEGELSSISASGNVGPHGCLEGCSVPIEGLALAPGGALWFAAGTPNCLECGGGSDLILQNAGTAVGEIPGGALAPADPAGPAAEDPYAGGQAKPPPPIARTGRALAVHATSAEITGFIDPRGYRATWIFRWGRTEDYGHFTFVPEFPFQTGDGAAGLEEFIEGLCPATTYHFELIAYGPGGRSLGGDRTLRTKSENQRPKHCPER